MAFSIFADNKVDIAVIEAGNIIYIYIYICCIYIYI